MIALPWPPPYLSPNARKHWAERAQTLKTYKAHCMWAMMQHKAALKGKSVFTITFCPPAFKVNGARNNNKIDRDNLISSFKAGQDAIAAMTGVDDHKFSVTYRVGERVQGGAVLIEITDQAEAAA